MSFTVPSAPQQRPLEITQQFPYTQRWLYLVPQLLNRQDALPAHEVSSTLPPCLALTSRPLLPSSRSFHCVLAFVFGTAAVLFSACLNVSATIPTRSRKTTAVRTVYSSPATSHIGPNSLRTRLTRYASFFDPGDLELVLVPHKDLASANGGHAAPSRAPAMSPPPPMFSVIVSLFSVLKPGFLF